MLTAARASRNIHLDQKGTETTQVGQALSLLSVHISLECLRVGRGSESGKNAYKYFNIEKLIFFSNIYTELLATKWEICLTAQDSENAAPFEKNRENTMAALKGISESLNELQTNTHP